MNPLNHLAIIMDGNGRWAKTRGHNRIWGHIRGARVARDTIQYCVKNEVPNLSLFAFSTENWQRSDDEVNFLMKLLARNLKRELDSLKKNNVKFHCIGSLDALPQPTREVVQSVITETSQNTGMNLILAVSYSGKQDILQATKTVAQKVKNDEIQIDEINEELITNYLSTSSLPDPDLIIRTSGELRISNFYLWQSAYSEFYFCKKMWPDFNNNDLDKALQFYGRKERRFGAVEEQKDLHV